MCSLKPYPPLFVPCFSSMVKVLVLNKLPKTPSSDILSSLPLLVNWFSFIRLLSSPLSASMMYFDNKRMAVRCNGVGFSL